MATATPKKKTIGNKVLYVPNPVTPNTSSKQTGPTPEQQKKNNPVTSKLVNNPSDLSKQQKVQKINTMNFGQQALKGSLSQSLYDSGGVQNYINKLPTPPTKTDKLPQEILNPNRQLYESNTAKSKFDQGFTVETKSLGYKTTGTGEIARKLEAKNIGNPNYTPELKAEINKSIEKNPDWFVEDSQVVQNNAARVKASNARYVAKVNYVEPTILSFEGTKVKLTPDQAKRYKAGELNTKFATLRPNGEIVFSKDAKSAEKLRANQSMSFPKPEGFGIVPSDNKKTAKQTTTENELMPFTTFESTGAKDVTRKTVQEFSPPTETLFGQKELKPVNKGGSLIERIGSGIELGFFGESEAAANLFSYGEEKLAGSKTLPKFKERESAGTLGINAFVGSALEGTWETLQSPFRSPEETVKKVSELNARTKTQYDKAYSLIEQDPFTQIPTFVAPIAAVIPELGAKAAISGGKILADIGKRATPQIVKDTAKQAKNIIEDPFEIGISGKEIKKSYPKRYFEQEQLNKEFERYLDLKEERANLKKINPKNDLSPIELDEMKDLQKSYDYRVQQDLENLITAYPKQTKTTMPFKPALSAQNRNLVKKLNKELDKDIYGPKNTSIFDDMIQGRTNLDEFLKPVKLTNKEKAIKKYGNPSESGVQDTSARGGNLVTELFDAPKPKGGTILDDIPLNNLGKLTKGAKRIYNSDYIFPTIGAGAASAGYGISQILSPEQKQIKDTKKLQKDQNRGILAFQGDYLLGYKEELENKRRQREELHPFFGLIQSPYLDQDQPQIVEQTPYLGTLQTPEFDNPYYPISVNEEVPIQAPFLDQIPYQRRIGKGEFLFPPNKYNLFTDQPIFSSDNEGSDKDFFRVFASAKEPFGSTELPLGEFVDSDYPIFEIKDRLSGSQIRKANKFGGLQNPLRAPKNIIDEDPYLNLFGFNPNKKKRRSKERSIFDMF